MNADFFVANPHLASPAALARADRGEKFKLPAHLLAINKDLMRAGTRPGSRVIINCPYQHGKSTLASVYFPAWVLLLWPDTRILLVSQQESFASLFGQQVRDIIERWGASHGVALREDSSAKGEWRIDGHDGGMVCKGPSGGVIGRPADLVIIDDLIKNHEQALSATMTESHWNFYRTAIHGRLRNRTSVVIVMTRWTRNDLVGQILRASKKTGDDWQVVKYKAIAEADDPLGRKPGEPLWPEEISLNHLKSARALSERWFRACWQQEPEEEDGAWFHPRAVAGRHEGWPLYHDAQDTWVLDCHPRKIIQKADCTYLVVADWAYSRKKTADHTAVGAFALTPHSDLLTLEVVNVRVGPRELAPLLCRVCNPSHGRWPPATVLAVEQGHPTLADDLGAYRVPPVRWVKTRSKNKLQRALSAIFMGENQRIYLPGSPYPEPWLLEYVSQLVAFTGDDDDEDDMADMTGMAGDLATQLRPRSSAYEDEPCVLTEGRREW